MASKLTVLLVDDHALVRRGFRRMLEAEATLQVVGKRATGWRRWNVRSSSRRT